MGNSFLRLTSCYPIADVRLMPNIELRLQSGTRSPGDIILNVQDKTFDYLMCSGATDIRISAYLDRDWPKVEAMYAEVYVSGSCAFETKVTKLIPGSRTRTGITLPGPMEEGEQLIVLVTRTPTTPAPGSDPVT